VKIYRLLKDGWIIVDFKTGAETNEKNNKYQEQLEFYTKIMQDMGYRIVDAKLLWLN